jgi:tetratricopeptide (TPR) repeat protein
MTILALALFLLGGQKADPAALSAQALELAQEKRFDEAELLWQQALTVAPDLFDALFNLGFMYYSRSQFVKAEPHLARAARVQPKDFNTHYILGATLLQLGRSDDALRQWRAALELQPDHVKLMMLMAVEYSKGRYFREAAAIGQRALGLKDDDPNLFFMVIKAHQDAGDHPSALQVAERAIRKFPNLPRANFEYGFELHRLGRPAEGLPYIKKAIETAPDYEEPYFFYGEILLKEGRYGEAIPNFRKAIALRPDYIAASVALGRALMALERYQEAVQELQRAIERDPRHPNPHLLLSQVYFRKGDEDRAAKEKEVSLRLRRENPTAMEAPQGRPFPE